MVMESNYYFYVFNLQVFYFLENLKIENLNKVSLNKIPHKRLCLISSKCKTTSMLLNSKIIFKSSLASLLDSVDILDPLSRALVPFGFMIP